MDRKYNDRKENRMRINKNKVIAAYKQSQNSMIRKTVKIVDSKPVIVISDNK